MEAFDLYAPEIDADPFPYYEILREQHPCYWSESGRLWILSRYDDIVQAARDWETFSSSQGNMIDELPGRAGATLGTTDPPRHDRLRALSQAAFTRKTAEQLVAPTLAIADRALERICDSGSFEFIDDFSSRITVGLLFRTMGLPERDHAEIRRRVILAVSTDKSVKGRNPEHIAAFNELSDFITAEVAVRRKHPTDDLITHLAEAEIDGDRLSEREIVLTAATFVMAGVESLSSFMSMLALNLHDHPEARARIVADLSLLEPAIEESLRFNTSAQRFKRRQGRARLWLRQPRSAEIFQSGRLRHRAAPAGSSRFRRWQAFLPRQPDGAAGHASGDAALSRAGAGVPPHDRQTGVEFVLEFSQPRRLAVRGAVTSGAGPFTWRRARTRRHGIVAQAGRAPR